MRSALAAAAQRRAARSRSGSLSTLPPSESDQSYIPELAAVAAAILYRSPLPSREGRAIYILNAAAFPDAFEVDYDALLPYVLARLPGEESLLEGSDYEVVFFAGGAPEGATAEKKASPGIGWYLQAYHVLSRAMRKRLQRLYIVHPRTWVRVLIGVFGTVVSPKFRRKLVHCGSLSELALSMHIERLLIPPSVFLHDRKISPEIEVPTGSGRRAFEARFPLPRSIYTGRTRLPRVLRETTSFLLQPANIVAEGLFRIPPHSVLASTLKESYDRGQRFLVFKEPGSVFVEPGVDEGLLREIRLEDSYGVHQAAAMIKTWYRELREPVFHEDCYQHIQEQFGDANVAVTPEQLVDLILPTSPRSPLTVISRDILTRHLLPLLSAVAAHEPRNKMNAENLAICFGMCLVRGSDQLADAKMASLIKRILSPAIEMWPQLCAGMEIDQRSFDIDLKPPTNADDYEDPLEIDLPSSDSPVEPKDGDDSEVKGKRSRAPTLPPRPRAASAAKKLLSLDVTSPLKRKPAAHGPESATTTDSRPSSASATPVDEGPPKVEYPELQPPRYSMVFSGPGHHGDIVDSPADFRPSTSAFSTSRDAHGYLVDEKLRYHDLPTPTDEHPALQISKRREVPSQQSESAEYRKASTDATRRPVRSVSEGAKLAAQKALTGATQRSALPPTPGYQLETAAAVSLASNMDDVFRRPTVPASAMRQASMPTHTLRPKPALPPRSSYTVPSIVQPREDSAVQVPRLPRPRAPSPGLLKRMETMEVTVEPLKPTLEPHQLNLRKNSVDDLRRLYEERASTAQTLAKVDSSRRGSTS